MMKPSLQGIKVELKCLRTADVQDLFEIYGNEATMEFASDEVFESIDTVHEMLESASQMEESGEALEWAIECKTEKKVIGTLGLHTFSLCGRECEIGCLVNSQFWRKGYMSDALPLVVEYAKAQGIKKLLANIDSPNYRSIGLFSKNGFQARRDGKYYLLLD